MTVHCIDQIYTKTIQTGEKNCTPIYFEIFTFANADKIQILYRSAKLTQGDPFAHLGRKHPTYAKYNAHFQLFWEF